MGDGGLGGLDHNEDDGQDVGISKEEVGRCKEQMGPLLWPRSRLDKDMLEAKVEGHQLNAPDNR